MSDFGVICACYANLRLSNATFFVCASFVLQEKEESSQKTIPYVLLRPGQILCTGRALIVSLTAVRVILLLSGFRESRAAVEIRSKLAASRLGHKHPLYFKITVYM